MKEMTGEENSEICDFLKTPCPSFEKRAIYAKKINSFVAQALSSTGKLDLKQILASIIPEGLPVYDNEGHEIDF